MIGLIFLAALFFALSPGILLSLPSGGSKITVAATHALVFAAVVYGIHLFGLESAREKEHFGVGFSIFSGIVSSLVRWKWR